MYTLTIPVLGGLRQENCIEFKTSLGCILRPEKQTTKQTNKNMLIIKTI